MNKRAGFFISRPLMIFILNVIKRIVNLPLIKSRKLLIVKVIIRIVNLPLIKPQKAKLRRLAVSLNLVPPININLDYPEHVTLFQRVLTLKTLEPQNLAPRNYKKSIDAEVLKEVSLKAGLGNNIIAISQDNFTKNIGGIQTIMNLEKNVLMNNAGNYWSVHPSTPSVYLTNDPILELLLNGNYIASFSSDSLGGLLQSIENQAISKQQGFRVVIHSLLGHDPESIAKNLKLLQKQEFDFYLHDFYSVCPSFKLLRNGLNFCHCPAVTSTSCKICIFGNIRASHVTRINSIIELEGLSLIAPSESTREIWLESIQSEKEVTVIPHLRLAPSSIRKECIKPHRRIVFFGPPNPEKGWEDYLKIQALLEDAIDFYVFSESDPKVEGIEFVPLNNSKGSINHTRDLLIAHEIDYAFVYPNWPETYSLVTAEAISAGVFVLTNESSGNVAALVNQFNSGAIFESPEKAVEFLLQDKKVSRKLQIYDAHFAGKITELVVTQN